jgi:hypothetical protein
MARGAGTNPPGQQELGYLGTPPMERREDQLRQKIQSKMTVATFLAGFTFATLLELLKEKDNFSGLSNLNDYIHNKLMCTIGTCESATGNFMLPAFSDMLVPLAAICLTTSIVLFIGTVYSYDMLIMPFYQWGGFKWVRNSQQQEVYINSSRVVTTGVPYIYDKENSVELNGINTILLDYLHDTMIVIWRKGFNAAVSFSTVGVFLFVIYAGSYIMALLFLIAVTVSIMWVRFYVRPVTDLQD